MRGECVRHPMTSVRRQLPPSMCSWRLIKHMLDLLATNVPTLSSVHQLMTHTFQRGRFCYPLIIFISFWVSSETMARCTWNPNIVHQNKFYWFNHDQDLVYPWVARAKMSIVWRLRLTFLFLGIPLSCSVLKCIRVPYSCLHMLRILKIHCRYNQE